MGLDRHPQLPGVRVPGDDRVRDRRIISPGPRHSAIARGMASIPEMGTNVPAMKVSGRITMKPIPCTASGERTSIPAS